MCVMFIWEAPAELPRTRMPVSPGVGIATPHARMLHQSNGSQMAAFGAFYEQVFPCVMLHTRFIWGSYQNVDHAPPVCGIPNLGPDSASYYMTTRCGMMGSAAARTRWGARVGDGFECVSCLYGRHPRSCLAPGCRCPRESVLQPPMRAC